MLTQSASVVAARAQALRALVVGLPAIEVGVQDTVGYAGGGALPMQALPGRAVALRALGLSADALARRLRTGTQPVLGRIEQDHVLIDLRTVADAELPALAVAIRQAGEGLESTAP